MRPEELAKKIAATRKSPALGRAICIDRVVLREIRLGLKEPFVTSGGAVTDRRVLLAEVRDSEGATAWSECVAMADSSYVPETIDMAWVTLREHVVPGLLGQEFSGPQHVHGHLEEMVQGHAMAKACMEMAAWALAAEKCGASLSSVLGGTRDRIATGVVIGLQKSTEDLAAKAREAVGNGYPRIKIKIKPGEDLENIRTVRETVGADMEITVDANAAYSLDDAEHLETFDEFGLSMLEQPLAWDDFAGHGELQAHIKTPICLDESIENMDRAEDMIRMKSGRIINVKPGRVGGFTQSLAIHDVCEEHDIPVWCGGMLETGIGRAYNVALASLPNFTLPGDLSPSARYWARDIVSPEWTMNAEGMVRVPKDKPGLGVEIDRDYIESLTVHKEEFQR